MSVKVSVKYLLIVNTVKSIVDYTGMGRDRTCTTMLPGGCLSSSTQDHHSPTPGPQADSTNAAEV